MKSLISYIKECCIATPMNTIGMGNIQPPTDNYVGTDLIVTGKPQKLKKKKSKTKNNKKEEE